MLHSWYGYSGEDEKKRKEEEEKQKQEEEEKRNAERKKPILQELEKEMTSGKEAIQTVLDILSVDIEQLENNPKTHGTRKLLQQYQLLYCNNKDSMENLQQKFMEAKSLIDSSESSEWMHLMKFQEMRKEVVAKCNTDEEKSKGLKSIYKLTPESLLAERTREIAESDHLNLPSKNNLRLYKLPVEKVHENNHIRRFQYGEEDMSKSHKYMMMVGMTGAGKSLLINNMINYIYGVQHSDDFRFKLIVEAEEINERSGTNSDSLAISMTSRVSAFTLYYQEGFRIPYSLTIIDTPGFGDTRGIKYDELIVKHIKEFFTDERIYGSSEITCIGMVMQASQARITTEQKYIVDSVLQLFAKDIADNIFMFFTFADDQEPPVTEVLKSEKIPHAEGKYYKFNNSALYAENESDFFWKFGYQNLEKLFNDLVHTESISLTKTKKNLEEREKLRLTLVQLKPKIDYGMEKLNKILQTTDMIKEIKNNIATSKNHTKQMRREINKKVDVKYSITNCYNCHHTCHEPCRIQGDMKKKCASIDSRGYCNSCPGKCHWDKHRNGTCKYVPTWITESVRAEDVFKEYKISITAKDAKKQVLIKLVDDYQNHITEVFKLVKEANDCSNRLDEIALRSSFLSNVQYIDRLIETEQKRVKSGKGQRLQQLRDFRDLAQLFQDCSTSSIDTKIQAQEKEIQKMMLEALDGIDDDDEYKEAKETAKEDFLTKLKGFVTFVTHGINK